MNVPCHSFCKQLSWTHANIFLSFSMQTQSGWRTAERYATPPVDKIRSARSIGLAALSSASPSVANRRTLSQCRELAKDLNDFQKVRMDGDGEATVKIKKTLDLYSSSCWSGSGIFSGLLAGVVRFGKLINH